MGQKSDLLVDTYTLMNCFTLIHNFAGDWVFNIKNKLINLSPPLTHTNIHTHTLTHTHTHTHTHTTNTYTDDQIAVNSKLYFIANSSLYNHI